jgi:hypothetical protein
MMIRLTFDQYMNEIPEILKVSCKNDEIKSPTDIFDHYLNKPYDFYKKCVSIIERLLEATKVKL